MHHNEEHRYLFLNGKEISKFKADNGIVNFLAQCCLGSVYGQLDSNDFKEVSLKGNVYDFSIDYSAGENMKY